MDRPTHFDQDFGSISGGHPINEPFTNGHAAETLIRDYGLKFSVAVVRASVTLRYAAETALPNLPEGPQLKRTSLGGRSGRRWVFFDAPVSE